MSNPLVSGQFIRLLDDRLRLVYRDLFKELPSMIDALYGVISSDKAWEEFYGMGSTPDVPAFDGQLEYLSIYPEFYSRIEPGTFAGALAFERNLIDDDRYDVIKSRQNTLIDSLHRVREKHGAQGFGYAFSSIFTFMQNEEGVSLCNSGHLTKSGASTSTGFSNAGSSAINKTAISATRILMRQFRGDVGQRIIVEPDLIVVPDTIYDQTCEAVGYNEAGAHSDRDPDSAHYGRINPQSGRWKVMAYPRLDDYTTKSWFMIDSKKMKEFMLWINRLEPDIETISDFETKMFKQSVYSRFGYGWTNWRWLYGMQVS